MTMEIVSYTSIQINIYHRFPDESHDKAEQTIGLQNGRMTVYNDVANYQLLSSGALSFTTKNHEDITTNLPFKIIVRRRNPQ